MALASTTLSTQMQLMTPTSAPGDAEQALADAYGVYMSGATAAGPILTAGIPAAVSAMAGAMTFAAGDSASAGAAKFVAGFAAFWAVLAASPATYWATATILTPPTFTGTSSSIASTFDSNTNSSKTLAQSMNDLVAVIHSGTLVTPTIFIPPSTTVPIT